MVSETVSADHSAALSQEFQQQIEELLAVKEGALSVAVIALIVVQF